MGWPIGCSPLEMTAVIERMVTYNNWMTLFTVRDISIDVTPLWIDIVFVARLLFLGTLSRFDGRVDESTLAGRNRNIPHLWRGKNESESE